MKKVIMILLCTGSFQNMFSTITHVDIQIVNKALEEIKKIDIHNNYIGNSTRKSKNENIDAFLLYQNAKIQKAYALPKQKYTLQNNRLIELATKLASLDLSIKE